MMGRFNTLKSYAYKAKLSRDILVQTVIPRIFLSVCGLFAVAYLLFQKKLLPLSVSKIVSKILFIPTFPITILLRIGNYWTKVDDTVYLGCAPVGWLGIPNELYKLNVRGVVNLCYEYEGPKTFYEKLGIKQLYLPTVDHFEPSFEQMKEAVSFIKYHEEKGEKVYVHCKAGHGRGASIALCWLISQNKDKSARDLNAILRTKRKVRSNLYQQKNIKRYFTYVQEKDNPKKSLVLQ